MTNEWCYPRIHVLYLYIFSRNGCMYSLPRPPHWLLLCVLVDWTGLDKFPFCIILSYSILCMRTLSLKSRTVGDWVYFLFIASSVDSFYCRSDSGSCGCGCVVPEPPEITLLQPFPCLYFYYLLSWLPQPPVQDIAFS